ncbi:hypothetical protein BX659_11341 [Orenia metallireducens]|uniref:DUF5673 domain-containing protein n=1 Tax=Orenia metallireducens TaxID=1413210 RepID=A0A285G5Y4_9FIRM|nr:hypothetical protein [Orenia metallireducens]PRX28311.1 hypothetical protein BX659_11341 [Orenia metallireducens]SNY19010.1 hypothetical protein SAMN06265827_10552 [Orenia metallireducens]
MGNINIVILLVFIYELISITINYYKIKEYGGNKIESFKHKSSLKNIIIVISIIGSIANILIFLESFIISNFIMLQFYIISQIFKIRKKIYIYQNGISYYGKFIKWDEISSIKVIDDQKIKVEVKDSLKAVSLDNIERQKELLDILHRKIDN